MLILSRIKEVTTTLFTSVTNPMIRLVRSLTFDNCKWIVFNTLLFIITLLLIVVIIIMRGCWILEQKNRKEPINDVKKIDRKEPINDVKKIDRKEPINDVKKIDRKEPINDVKKPFMMMEKPIIIKKITMT